MHAKCEFDLIKTGQVIHIWNGPFNVDRRKRRRRRRRIGNAVVDLAMKKTSKWILEDDLFKNLIFFL